jgi:16S rRNA (cytidine1402-2'-O)-methyltransferase
VGTLYLVATPIGNLDDISPRALRILREARLIAAEDTRVTRKLLSHYAIQSRPISYYEHNKLSRLGQILEALVEGDVALVSDAGTPALNDPGYELVCEAIRAGHQVSAIPGPASPVAALVVSGLPTDSFLYLGYVPRKGPARGEAFSRVAQLPYTLIFLESPHRLLGTLGDMQSALGDRTVAIARELTKIHEEIWRGPISKAREHFREPRGEFVLVVGGKAESQPQRWTQAQVLAAVSKRLKDGAPPTTAAAELTAKSGWSRREIYKLATEPRKPAP